MIQHYAVMAVHVLFLGLGFFNIFRGIQIFRKRKTKKWLGIVRSLVGVPLIAISVGLYYYLRMLGRGS